MQPLSCCQLSVFESVYFSFEKWIIKKNQISVFFFSCFHYYLLIGMVSHQLTWPIGLKPRRSKKDFETVFVSIISAYPSCPNEAICFKMNLVTIWPRPLPRWDTVVCKAHKGPAWYRKTHATSSPLFFS